MDSHAIATLTMSADRIIEGVGSLLLIVIGYKLFVLGASGKINVSLKSKAQGEATLKDLSPGAFCFALGCALGAWIIAHPIQADREVKQDGLMRDVVAGSHFKDVALLIGVERELERTGHNYDSVDRPHLHELLLKELEELRGSSYREGTGSLFVRLSSGHIVPWKEFERDPKKFLPSAS